MPALTTEQDIRQALSALDVLGLTMHFEAVGDTAEGHSSVEERIAIGCVVRTRVRLGGYGGDSYKGVCLAHGQFSCWEPAGGEANHAALLVLARQLAEQPTGPVPPLYQETRYLASGILQAFLLDRTEGATHYYAPAAMRPPDTVPSWAVGHAPVAMIGRQRFYRLRTT